MEIIRHEKPSPLDDLPDGTACFINHQSKSSLEAYLRVNQEWIYMGIFASVDSFREYIKEKRIA